MSRWAGGSYRAAMRGGGRRFSDHEREIRHALLNPSEAQRAADRARVDAWAARQNPGSEK